MRENNEQNSEQNSCQSKRFNSFTQHREFEGRSNFTLANDEVRIVDSMIDIIYPPVAFPSNRIFKAIGEDGIREMVDYHHELLFKSRVGSLFPANSEARRAIIDKSADFFVEALGGDDVFTSLHGRPKLRERHFKIPIDENDREIWLAMYKKTLKDLNFPTELLEEFWNWIEPLSIRMINRRTNMDPIKRHHWYDVKKEFFKNEEI